LCRRHGPVGPGCFVVCRAEIAERRVTATQVVEALDEVEDGRRQLPPRRPAPAVEELTLERREEALGHRVVEAVADAAHRTRQSGLSKPAPEGEAGVLASVVGVVTTSTVGRRWATAMLSASSTSSVRRWSVIDHPTTRRLNASM